MEFPDPARFDDIGDGGDRRCPASGRRYLGAAMAALALATSAWLVTESDAGVGKSPGPEVSEDCIQAPRAGCIFDWSVALAAAMPDRFDRAAAFVRIAEAQALAGRTNAARETLSRALSSAKTIGSNSDIVRPLTKRFDDEIPYVRAEILTRIASAQLAIDESNRAWGTLSQAISATGTIRSGYWRAHRLILIAQVQIAGGALPEARASIAAANAHSAAAFGHSLRETAAAQAGAHDFDGALVTAQAIRGDSLRDSSLTDIVEAQARAGDYDGALVTAERIGKPYFRMLAMHHMATVRAEEGDLGGAMRAAEGILEIFHGALGQFLWRDAEILYSDSLKVIAEAHVAAGAYEEALSLAAQMPDPLPDVTTHGAVAMAQISAGDLDAARVTAEGMYTGRHLRYGDDCVEVLASLASAYAAKGDPDAAKEAIGTATRIADQIIYYPDRARAFTSIWKARALLGEIEAAGQAFEGALAAAGDTDDVEARIGEFIAVATTAARIGERKDEDRAFAAARNLAARIEDPPTRASALAKAAVALAKAGETERALRLFSGAFQAAASIEEPNRSVVVLVEIASALAAHKP